MKISKLTIFDNFSDCETFPQLDGRKAPNNLSI